MAALSGSKRAQPDPEEYQCAVCTFIMVEPVVAPCGHEFCGHCLESWRNRARHNPTRCPCCRQPVYTPSMPSLGVSRVLDKAIKSLFPGQHQARLAEVQKAAAAAAAVIQQEIESHVARITVSIRAAATRRLEHLQTVASSAAALPHTAIGSARTIRETPPVQQTTHGVAAGAHGSAARLAEPSHATRNSVSASGIPGGPALAAAAGSSRFFSARPTWEAVAAVQGRFSSSTGHPSSTAPSRVPSEPPASRPSSSSTPAGTTHILLLPALSSSPLSPFHHMTQLPGSLLALQPRGSSGSNSKSPMAVLAGTPARQLGKPAGFLNEHHHYQQEEMDEEVEDTTQQQQHHQQQHLHQEGQVKDSTEHQQQHQQQQQEVEVEVEGQVGDSASAQEAAQVCQEQQQQGSTGAWQCEAEDVELRCKLVSQLVHHMYSRRPGPLGSSLTDRFVTLITAMEERLYRSSPSKEHYSDLESLPARVSALARGEVRRQLQMPSGLHPGAHEPAGFAHPQQL